MKTAEAKDRRAAEKLYDEHHKARIIYSRAKREALDKVRESLKPLRTASMGALAAYQESLAVLIKYTTPHPRPGDPPRES